MTRPAAGLVCLALAACGTGGVPASNPPAGGGAQVASLGPVEGGALFATACGVEGEALGRPIATRAGYTLHDTDPASTGPRVHHITGFADGCPRRVTAALALFGDVGTHEVTRYAATDRALSPTDAAYESIKAEICGVPALTPCGARLSALEANTVFVSLYPTIDAERHEDLLLHAGEVVAADR